MRSRPRRTWRPLASSGKAPISGTVQIGGDDCARALVALDDAAAMSTAATQHVSVLIDIEPASLSNRNPQPRRACPSCRRSSMLELDASGVDHRLPALQLLLEERIGFRRRQPHRLDPDLAHLLLKLRLLH